MSVIETVLSTTLLTRRQTRTYDVSSVGNLIAYLEGYLTPVGSIIAKLSSTVPGDGWLLADGRALNKATYDALYAEIGGAFGETASTFNLPDLTDTYLVGAGAIAGRATGGANSITLTVGQMPAHGHAVTDPGHTHAFTGTPHSHGVTDPGHTHTAGVDGGATDAAAGGDVATVDGGSTGSATTGVSVDSETAGGSNASNTTGITIGDAGSGDSIDNRPSSIGVFYFIKVQI